MYQIFFTPIINVAKEYYPEPSSKNIPDWYKKESSFRDSKNFVAINGLGGNQTIKKCIPVFDAISAGYIIKTFTDIYVGLSENGIQEFFWPGYDTSIVFHDMQQALTHPVFNGRPYPKWVNPWSIKTPNGFSCLFVPPMHRENNFFTILPGIVDTDTYLQNIHFPFVMNDVKFEGIIPAGTPICQVIPFKRNSFQMKIGGEKQIEEINKFSKIYPVKWLNNYKSRFWHKKEYR